MTFDANSVPDQNNQIIVVTGGNSGIGYEAARVLVARRALVVLACRDAGKMDAAAEALRRESPAAKVDTVVLDLSSLASVRAGAATLAQRHARIDVLVNNAGVMAIPYRETADGVEMQFGTNHLGHFALTGLLLDQLAAAPGGGRVVTVSSMLHRSGRIDFDDIPRPRKYSESGAYSASKLANLLFAYELDRRARAAGLALTSVGCHPGYAATNLQGVGPRMSGSAVRAGFMRAMNALLAQPASAGALPTLMAATSRDVSGGQYFGPTGMMGMRGAPEKTESNAASHDVDVARRLWEVSEQFSGVRFDFAKAAAAIGRDRAGVFPGRVVGSA